MTVVEDRTGLAALAARFLAMSVEGREEFLLNQPPAAVALLERAIADQIAVGWRATPATMAHYLTKGERKLWPYVRLLGKQFVEAFNGVEPHQQWWMGSQYGKTTCLMDAVVWALDANPRKRIMYVSYDANKAVEEGGRARDFAREHAGDLRFNLRDDRTARGRWMTEQGGGLYCVGVQGGIIGWPVDILLLDDLFKGWQGAHSETTRNMTWNVYRSQCRFRMQSILDPIIVAGTRMHYDDVQARLLDIAEKEPDADQWKVVRLSTVAEPYDPESQDRYTRMPDPLGRKPGELLEPERFPEREVKARRAGAGAYLWACMEQQRPGPEKGTEVLRAWWRIGQDIPPAFDEVITSWDMKLKDKESGDFVVGGTWGRTGSDFWLLAQLRGQWNQPTTENAIALAAVREPRARIHVIENTGNGPEVMAALRAPSEDYEVSDEIAGLLGMTKEERDAVQQMRRRGIPGLVPENVKGDKRVRMRAHSGLIEAGNVHLWERMPGLEGYLEEMSAFPNGAFDDQVDQTSQALKRLRVGSATATASTQELPATPIARPSMGVTGRLGRGAGDVRPTVRRYG